MRSKESFAARKEVLSRKTIQVFVGVYGRNPVTPCGAETTLVYSLPMKQYLIDELRLEDYEKIKAYMDETLKTSPMEGLYWIRVKEDLLTDMYASHKECGPHYFALELQEHRISCELLVRAENSIRCSCIRYASKEQREWLVEFIDAILARLEISI